MTENPDDAHSEWDPPIFDDALLVDHKHDYIKKPKFYKQQTKKTCVICKIINNDPDISSFEICRNVNFIVFLNLYPYTNAHLLISPIKHVIGYEEFGEQDINELGDLTKRCIKMVKHSGGTESINVGWNQGDLAGGSIKHFHIHIIPRYPNELNFMEIIARTRPYIRTLEDTQKDLQSYSPYLLGHCSFEEVVEQISNKI